MPAMIKESPTWKEFRLHAIENYEFGDLCVRMYEGEPVEIVPEKSVKKVRFGRFKKKSNGAIS